MNLGWITGAIIGAACIVIIASVVINLARHWLLKWGDNDDWT